MQVLSLHADARADARDRARPDLLERRLKRFQPRFQPRVRALAERHPRLKDLALSFPALLFALAAPRASFDPAPVVALVIDGARLRDVADCARVPLWLRRFGPEAFGGPLPLLPQGALFWRQVANCAPRSPNAAQFWLETIGNAARWADEEFAAWAAKEIQQSKPSRAKNLLRLLCLWAWHSKNGFVSAPDTPWTATMKFDSARAASGWWLERTLFRLEQRGAKIRDLWLKPGVVDGFAFEPIDCFETLSAEAVAMENCLMGYAGRLARNHARLWSVRLNGERVATAEIRLPHNSPVPHVTQLSGKKNERVAIDVWFATRAWLNAQDIAHLNPNTHERRRGELDRRIWIEQWRPYWLAKRVLPTWLPLGPSRAALAELSW